MSYLTSQPSPGLWNEDSLGLIGAGCSEYMARHVTNCFTAALLAYDGDGNAKFAFAPEIRFALREDGTRERRLSLLGML